MNVVAPMGSVARWSIFMALFAMSGWVFAGLDMRSKSYKKSFDQAWSAAQAACASHDWKIKESSKADGTMLVRTKVSAFTWGAKLHISMHAVAGEVKVVVTASSSQVTDKKKLKADLDKFFSAFEASL